MITITIKLNIDEEHGEITPETVELLRNGMMQFFSEARQKDSDSYNPFHWLDVQDCEVSHD